MFGAQVTHAINMKRASAKREDYAGMRFNAKVAFDKQDKSREVQEFKETPLERIGEVDFPTVRSLTGVTNRPYQKDHSVLRVVEADEGEIQVDSMGNRQDYWSARWQAVKKGRDLKRSKASAGQHVKFEELD